MPLFIAILIIFKYTIGEKQMLNVRLADYRLCGKKLFTWLSLAMFLMSSFCAVLFSTRCPAEKAANNVIVV